MYELYEGDREIGRLCKAQDGAVVLWLDGFLTSADAAAAASLAYSGLLGRKWLIAGCMLLQGGALGAIALAGGFWPWVGATTLLGIGTAMVYPTLLAAVGDVAHPSWRGSAVGVYRLWRDSGYAVGALLAGTLADLFGMAWSIGAVAILTCASGLLVVVRMPETLRSG